MSITIRKTQKSDLPQISLLYSGRKSLLELNWLLRNPKDENDFNSFVAVDENSQVIGAIGYALNAYRFRDKRWTGVVPFSWIVEEGNRGLVGIQLILAIYKLGQFGFALQGSEGAKKVYSMVKLVHLSNAQIYIKLIKPLRFVLTSHRNVFINIIKALYYMPSMFGNNQRSFASDMQLVKYDKMTVTGISFSEAFTPLEDVSRINWLLNCPLVDTYGFNIQRKDGSSFGICVLYIKKELKRGKIVYLSHLGEDFSLWEDAINHILSFFKSKNCCSVSILAHNQHLVGILEKKRFIKYTKRYNVYLRDPNNELESVPMNTWHLTYYESDRGYISFNY